MLILILKLTLTPLLIAVATLAARRWGPTVGGWVAGLPLTSGPISAFMAVEQGRQFAADSAQTSILGMIAVAAFCVAYARAARRFGWQISLALAFCCYTPAVLLLAGFEFSLASGTFLTLAVLCLALRVLGPAAAAAPYVVAPWWDIPLRMLTATAMVVTLTALAAYLGPAVSGLLLPFPVFTCVMATFSHSQYGEAAVHQFLRGIITAAFGFVAFYIVLAMTVGEYSLTLAFLLATLAVVVVNLATLRLFVRA